MASAPAIDAAAREAARVFFISFSLLEDGAMAAGLFRELLTLGSELAVGSRKRENGQSPVNGRNFVI